MRLKPAPGRAVRDPATMQLLPEDGRDVNEHDPFWRRRLRDGDVVEVKKDEGGHHHARAHDHKGA